MKLSRYGPFLLALVFSIAMVLAGLHENQPSDFVTKGPDDTTVVEPSDPVALPPIPDPWCSIASTKGVVKPVKGRLYTRVTTVTEPDGKVLSRAVQSLDADQCNEPVTVRIPRSASTYTVDLTKGLDQADAHRPRVQTGVSGTYRTEGNMPRAWDWFAGAILSLLIGISTSVLVRDDETPTQPDRQADDD